MKKANQELVLSSEEKNINKNGTEVLMRFIELLRKEGEIDCRQHLKNFEAAENIEHDEYKDDLMFACFLEEIFKSTRKNLSELTPEEIQRAKNETLEKTTIKFNKG